MNIASLFSEKPIAYHRPLVRKFGIVPGVFLGQLLYWQGKGYKGDWVYKTQEEWKSETGLTRSNQETARKRLIKMGILEEKLIGVPATLHYKVSIKNLEKSLGIFSLPESSKLDCGNPANQYAETLQTTTKNTQEITTRREPPPPQIEAIRFLTKRYPPKVIWSELIIALGEHLALDRLEQCFKAWVLHGYKPTNLAWITDWYVKGIPPPPTRSLPTHAEMNRGGTGRLVI